MNLQSLDKPIETATQALLACQQPDGHWVFELEADATIPAEEAASKLSRSTSAISQDRWPR